ncbi:MAG: hypothetical protein KIT58_16735 [Planctomycetota bacterium]|nr:hypothetical protein [Planctomycetota bacterium]
MSTTLQASLQQAELQVAIGPGLLAATRLVPARPRGLVLLAEAGGGRDGPDTTLLARALAAADLAVVVVDLLGPDEGPERADVALLASRLGQVTAWADRQEVTAGLPLAYVARGHAAAAAFVAAAFLGERVRAVVTRDGRPDLAGPFLAHVRAATLLIFGGPADGHAESTSAQLQRQARVLLARAEVLALPVDAADTAFLRTATSWLSAQLAPRQA